MVKIVKSNYYIEYFDSSLIMSKLERAGRICYQSEHKLEPGSADKFIKMIIDNGHESVLEHEKITVRIICDRGVSHEIVRHRIASYSQESTRYCNYTKEQFDTEITVIEPNFNNSFEREIWYQTMLQCEKAYISLIQSGVSPQIARSVLPNSLKTELIITMNLREWRHFLKLRTHKTAHPQMREITVPLLQEFKKYLPIIFSDIEPIILENDNDLTVRHKVCRYPHKERD